MIFQQNIVCSLSCIAIIVHKSALKNMICWRETGLLTSLYSRRQQHARQVFLLRFNIRESNGSSAIDSCKY